MCCVNLIRKSDVPRPKRPAGTDHTDLLFKTDDQFSFSHAANLFTKRLMNGL